MTTPISVQLYSLRDALANDFEAVIEELAQVGFNEVEPFRGLPVTAQEASQVFQANRLDVRSAHLAIPDGEDEVDVLKTAAAYEINTIVVPWYPAETFTTRDGIQKFCDRMNKANITAQREGYRLAYHNHEFEFVMVDGVPAYDLMLAELDSSIVMEPDVYWVQVGGQDPIELVKRLGQRAPLLHLKDGPADPAQPKLPMTAAGSGNVDLQGIIQAAGSNAEAYIVELDHCATDMMQAVRESYQYLSGGDRMNPVKVGIIGTGNIFSQYIKGCRQFPILDVVAVSDLNIQLAEARAAEYDLIAMSAEDLLADDNIELVINLTPPKAHVTVALNTIAAGKHIYTEKPLAINLEDGRKIMGFANEAEVRVGCAPDTFLGGGLQTCRKLIDDGWIGTPIAATAFMTSRGPESWHPNPVFFYEVGGGPMLDMGPYYITALVSMLGGVRQLNAMTARSFEERIATSKEKNGLSIPVEVSTHNAGTLQFDNGTIATMLISFDIWRANLPRIEIYGSEGTFSVPDPNTFGGPISVWLPNVGQWQEIPLTHSPEVGRGIGVADMAQSIRNDEPHRASGDLALHVLEVMEAFDFASETGQTLNITTPIDRPTPLPLGSKPGMIYL